MCVFHSFQYKYSVFILGGKLLSHLLGLTTENRITTLGSETIGGSVYILNLTRPLDFNSIPIIRQRMHEVASFNCTIWTADCNSKGSQAVIGKYYTTVFIFDYINLLLTVLILFCSLSTCVELARVGINELNILRQINPGFSYIPVPCICSPVL